MVSKKMKIMEFIEGVTFKFNGNFEKIILEKLNHIPDDQLPGASGGFDPHRSVFNFRLYHEDDPDTDLTIFDGTIEMTIYFIKEDLDSVENLAALDFGYHNGTKWISGKVKHNLKKTKKDQKPWVGYGTMKIKKKWADPVMAWGK